MSELVDLGSLVVPAEALRLLLALEQRDLLVSNVKGALRVSQKHQEAPPELSNEDRAAITLHKAHLLALVEYVAQKEAADAEKELPPSSRRSRNSGRGAGKA